MLEPATDQLQLEVAGHAAVITLNNPPANTFVEESLHALRDLVDALDSDPTIYSLVITGAGERFFSAGADLNLFAQADKATAKRIIDAFGVAFDALAAFRGVSIAAINGYAMGGGLECALACDIRIAESQAVLALPETGVGVLPGAGGTQRLPRLVGEGWAKKMILCGEQFGANHAERIALVQEVVAAGEAKARGLALAAQVAGQSPMAVRHAKVLIERAGGAGDSADALAAERERFAELFDTRDQKEGVAAFLEKRKPVWTNG